MCRNVLVCIAPSSLSYVRLTQVFEHDDSLAIRGFDLGWKQDSQLRFLGEGSLSSMQKGLQPLGSVCGGREEKEV